MRTAGLPSFFFLWSPHALQKRFELARIQLPTYRPRKFAEGQSDYPVDVLEKVFWPGLGKLAPLVLSFYNRFVLDEEAQNEMLSMVASKGMSAQQAACAWITDETNKAEVDAWRPPEEFVCPVGHIVLDEPGVCSEDELAVLRVGPERRRADDVPSAGNTPRADDAAGSTADSVTEADGAEGDTPMDLLKSSNRPCFDCVLQCAGDSDCEDKVCKDGPPPKCEVCRAGSSSEGGAQSTCSICAAGMFQRDQGQYSCIDCDNLGDYYQDQPNATACIPCPANTMRFSGKGSSANVTSCLCQKGAPPPAANGSAATPFAFLCGRCRGHCCCALCEAARDSTAAVPLGSARQIRGGMTSSPARPAPSVQKALSARWRLCIGPRPGFTLGQGQAVRPTTPGVAVELMPGFSVLDLHQYAM